MNFLRTCSVGFLLLFNLLERRYLISSLNEYKYKGRKNIRISYEHCPIIKLGGFWIPQGRKYPETILEKVTKKKRSHVLRYVCPKCLRVFFDLIFLKFSFKNRNIFDIFIFISLSVRLEEMRFCQSRRLSVVLSRKEKIFDIGV